MSKKKNATTIAALKVLCQAYDCDQAAIHQLMLMKCKCNKNLANHPKIPIMEDSKGDTYIRVIGLINGILEELGESKIVQTENPETGLIDGFDIFTGS